MFAHELKTPPTSVTNKGALGTNNWTPIPPKTTKNFYKFCYDVIHVITLYLKSGIPRVASYSQIPR